MERLKVLAAATALGEFTHAQLAAYSGTNENTVRTVVRRSADLFEPVDEHTELLTNDPRRPGRRARRFRLRDVELVRAMLIEHERTTSKIGDLVVPEDSAQIEAALRIAEDSLLQAMCADDHRTIAAHLRVAENTLIGINADGDALARGLNKRLEAVWALVEFVRRRFAKSSPQELREIAEAIAAISAHQGSDRARLFLPLLSQAALVSYHLPPIQFLTIGDTTPSETLFGEPGSPEWVVIRDDGAQRSWTQEWARALLDDGLITGAVVPHSQVQSETELALAIRSVADVDRPTYVISDDRSPRLATLDVAALEGATILSTNRLASALSLHTRRKTMAFLGASGVLPTSEARSLRGPLQDPPSPFRCPIQLDDAEEHPQVRRDRPYYRGARQLLVDGVRNTTDKLPDPVHYPRPLEVDRSA